MRDDGDVETLPEGATEITAEYTVPYLAHATMEPMNAVAWFRDGQLDIWAGNQYPTKAVALGADSLVILSNIPGLLREFPDESTLITHIPKDEIEE